MFSSLEEEGATSICIVSASVGVASLVVSGAAVAFCVFTPTAAGGPLGSFARPTSSATSFWCWLEDVLEEGDGGSSVSGCTGLAAC